MVVGDARRHCYGAAAEPMPPVLRDRLRVHDDLKLADEVPLR